MFHLPLKIVQRLNMPQAFAGDGTEGQGTEKVDEEDFRYVKELSFSERFKFPTVVPIIDRRFCAAGKQHPSRCRHESAMQLADPFVAP